ncbi:unnamed protein product [Rotaria sordida]|uniref:Uncharacterized protein n=3 Tax=Rotaria sordida TaxID=392033 RepID=A0A815WZ39_9BILA|nr:unnamed protein product [Rotaria sordida]CAF1549713.1 unnamed protein product [Rotaria sordida]
MNMFQQFLCQIFSNQCQLTYLELDINQAYYNIYQCLKLPSHSRLNTNTHEFQFYCITLRCLKIHLKYTCFLEDLVERTPNLEQLSVHIQQLQRHSERSDSNIQDSILLNKNWFNKIPKLECFTMKSFVNDDSEFIYLKWLLNNINYVKKLEIHLYKNEISKTDQTIWKSIIDANFIRQYCLPDEIINLKYFYFYIRLKHQLLLNNIEKIINSFKIDPFFILHQWTDVKYFYDEYRSYHHIFSSNFNKFQFSDFLMNHASIYDWLGNRHIGLHLNLSIHSFLEQFDKQCPSITSITIYPKHYIDESIMETLLTIIFEMKQRNLNNNQFRYITKLRFGNNYSRIIQPFGKLTDQDKIHAKIYSYIISMTVQLKYLLIERLEWFLYIIQYAFDDLRMNALSTVRHIEFGISSCHFGNNESIHIGKHLVPLLSTFMPHVQTLRLWRPDDFPWTSIRPNFRPIQYGFSIRQWQRYLRTLESITEHVNVFECDLCQLVEQLKQLVYLDIYGSTASEKVEPYRLMVQNRFPNSRIDIQISRFRLWM